MRFIVLFCALLFPFSITASAIDFHVDDYLTKREDGKLVFEMKDVYLDENRLSYIFSDLPADVRELHLINNGISTNFIPLITEFLRKNFIQKLTLENTFIGDEGAELLAQFLEENCSLSHFSLAQGFITNEGFSHLYRGIHGHQTLQVLDLTNNKLSKGCGILFLNTLYLHACNLSELILDENPFIREDQRAFTIACAFLKEKYNRSLAIYFDALSSPAKRKRSKKEEPKQHTSEKKKSRR